MLVFEVCTSITVLPPAPAPAPEDGDPSRVNLNVTNLEVSPIVTVELVATIVPKVDPVLTCSWKLSDPSVALSFDKVLVIVAVLLVIVKEPVTAASVKSDVFTVPVITLVEK
jgi:hypothetical protein